MTCTALCPGVEILPPAALGDLAGEWEALLERSYDNRIFLTPVWYRLWWDHFGAETSHILSLRGQDSSLRALLPLKTEERNGERILSLSGDWNVADYMDGLAEEQEAHSLLTTLWSCALSELGWDRLELRHVPSSSPLLPALKEAALEEGIEVSVEHDEVCPVARLCADWEGYLQTLTKKQRHEIRRKLRRAQEGAEWSWRTAKSRMDLEADLPVFFRLHEASAGEKERFMTAGMRAFFRALSYVMLHQGVLRLSIFRREGVDVATVMGFVYGGRYLLYNSGYDPAFAAYSPGIGAVSLAMQDAIAQGAESFDFLSGDEPYKYQLGASNTYTCRAEARR